MNIARRICRTQYQNVRKNFYRKLRLSSSNCDSAGVTQPQVQEEKFDFEDLQVLERTERRKEKIPPFMKDVFVSIFNRDLLAFPEILNKDESTALDNRVALLDRVFSDPNKTKDDRKTVLKHAKMYSAPVELTNNGLAMNHTESLRYLEVISSDLQLAQEISDHWVCLKALQTGLDKDLYDKIIGDVTTGERSITLCVKERISERPTQADFKTTAMLDGNEIWHVNGEKVCPRTSGYLLVLCKVEPSQLRAFLVHPSAEGVSYKDTCVTFNNTPATPLELATEETLSQVLGASRLHTATLHRANLLQAVHACAEFTKPRYFAGKPLSDLATIKATIGEALLQVYASESAEYFTAGLLDGYTDPDAELEMAMCRNFIAHHGQKIVLDILAVQGSEDQARGVQLLQEARTLALRGESVQDVQLYVALNGIHHAGKTLATEIKQIRNPLFNPTFILKKMISDRHQEKDNPKLTLYLAEHLHPSLQGPAQQLEYAALRMRYACETLMSRHGVEVARAHTELTRLADAATEILAMTAVLARASRAYCIGLRNAEIEMKLAACFVEKSKDRVQRLIKEIDDGEFLNLDHFKIQFGKKVLDNNSTLVEKPTARVFW